MTPAMLAAIVIQFCQIKSQAEIVMDNTKYACTNYMINCSVGNGGTITQKRIDQCKTLFKKKKMEEILEGYL
jgi:hypothetical protein